MTQIDNKRKKENELQSHHNLRHKQHIKSDKRTQLKEQKKDKRQKKKQTYSSEAGIKFLPHGFYQIWAILVLKIQ